MNRVEMFNLMKDIVQSTKSGSSTPLNKSQEYSLKCLVDMICDVNDIKEVSKAALDGAPFREYHIIHPLDLLIIPKWVSVHADLSYADLRSDERVVMGDPLVPELDFAQKADKAMDCMYAFRNWFPNLREAREVTLYDARGEMSFEDVHHENKWAFEGRVPFDGGPFYWEGMPVLLKTPCRDLRTYNLDVDSALEKFIRSIPNYHEDYGHVRRSKSDERNNLHETTKSGTSTRPKNRN